MDLSLKHLRLKSTSIGHNVLLTDLDMALIKTRVISTKLDDRFGSNDQKNINNNKDA